MKQRSWPSLFSSGYSGEESAAKLVYIVGRIQVLVVVGVMFLFYCWLLAGGNYQILETTLRAYSCHFSIFFFSLFYSPSLKPARKNLSCAKNHSRSDFFSLRKSPVPSRSSPDCEFLKSGPLQISLFKNQLIWYFNYICKIS